MNVKTRKIVLAAMFAAIICLATMIIKIPSPLKGYINLGDCVVLLAGWILSPIYAFLAAGIGSMFADVLSGYALYAPATFIIKGVVAIIACYVFRILEKKHKCVFSGIISGLTAETVMVMGYLLFESLLYGFVPSLVNVPANAIQGVAGIVIGTTLVKAFEKIKL